MEVYWLVMIVQFRLGRQVMSLTSHAVHVGISSALQNVSSAADASADHPPARHCQITPRSMVRRRPGDRHALAAAG